MKRVALIVISTLIAINITACSKTDNTNNINNGSNENRAEEILGISKNNQENNSISEGNQSLSEIIQNEDVTENNNNQVDLGNLDQSVSNTENNTNNSGSIVDTNTLLSSIVEIRAIDCGQADSILLHSIDSNILIDAGADKNAASIERVLDDLGVKKIDILIATHAHSDHIGGMQTIVEDYDIGNIIMSPQTHTTKTYENLLTAIDEKGYQINIAVPGDRYSAGEIDIEIIGPCDKYDGDLNNSSVVAVASYGDIDILLTGDAEMQSEKDYVKYLTDKDIEILKVGHHGSDTSTSSNLLEIMRPEIALISCGEGNEYGHPTQETLSKLDKYDVEVYRTDMIGDIIVRTDGKEYTIEDNGGDILLNNTNTGNNEDNNFKNNSNTSNNVDDTANKNSNDANLVYSSKSGKKYHSSENCTALYVAREINKMTEQEAISSGLTKCKKCWE